MLEMKLEFIKGILFCRLDGELVRKNVLKINDNLINFIIRNEVKYLVYNFYDIKKIDISGIDALLNTKYVIKNNEGKLFVVEASKDLKKLFNKYNIPVLSDELSALHTIRMCY